jgi:hypothetical protein
MKHTWGIVPGTVTYNALLELCSLENDYERGCQARTRACARYAACAVLAAADPAAQLIDRMLSEDVQPDFYTIAAVSSRKSLRTYLKRSLADQPDV